MIHCFINAASDLLRHFLLITYHYSNCHRIGSGLELGVTSWLGSWLGVLEQAREINHKYLDVYTYYTRRVSLDPPPLGQLGRIRHFIS